jgi:F-type H+-transporting ATPase subunit gamma
MATLRDVLRKIGAVRKTRQITRAMNMVAAAKLRNSQQRQEGFEPYTTKFFEVMGNLASGISSDIHPLLEEKEDISRLELLHFTADRGLCGSFNSNLINRAEKWIKDQKAKGIACDLTLVGKKGKDYFSRRDYNITNSYTDVYGGIDISFINELTALFMHRYLENKIHGVYMIYSRFISTSRQQATLVRLIPIEASSVESEEKGVEEIDYLFEPDAEKLLVDLLPKFISVQILNAFLHNETSEHAARMAAMDNATKNCDELIENLTLLYNKARQAAITADLMDIVGGAEALKKA